MCNVSEIFYREESTAINLSTLYCARAIHVLYPELLRFIQIYSPLLNLKKIVGNSLTALLGSQNSVFCIYTGGPN